VINERSVYPASFLLKRYRIKKNYNIHMIQNFTKKHSGFTLVELLVVIAIIGILASIVLVSLGGGTTRAKDTRIITDLDQIRRVAEITRVADGNYANIWTNGNITVYINDMSAQGTTNILRVSNAAGYCVEVTMSGGRWGCVNSGLVIITNNAGDTPCAGNNATGVPTGINCQ
ncbi:MAG: type II secretion system protein, partial [Methylococcales bacterium]|nr:type II secretion system protein [Methylococcales bacterium]